MDEDENGWERDRQTRKEIEERISSIDSLFVLNGVHQRWEDRMKQLAANILKPGNTGVIEEMDGGLSALDYIWGLAGDYSWSSKQTEPFRARALDYYVGRKCRHIWGTGVLVKMDREQGSKAQYGIRVRLPCGTEGCKGKITVYARPGCHNGAFCYVYDKEGNYLADLRNQWFHCTAHRKKVRT